MSKPRLGLRFAVLALFGLVALPAAAQTTIAPPADIAARKQLNIALFAAFPPMAYKNIETNELVGVDVDLAAYVGQKLGVAIGWQETSYESAVNSLMTGRVDLAFSLLDDPAAADRLDYLPYLSSGMLPYTLAAHAPIASALDLCGLKVGANRRNGFDAAMRKWSEANCLQAGRPAIEVMETDGTPAARLQLKQGRVDAIVQSSESVPYTMQQEKGVYVKIGKALTSQMIVIAFPKRSAALRDAVTAAMKAAVTDGSYAKALAKHGLQDNSVADQIATH
jgi:polar amino acid transport system substrate-binding protein